LPAIESVIAEGINVNITMLFARHRYDEVVAAYLRGLDGALAGGRKLQQIASVASLFVSRVDTLIDKILSDKGADPALQGKTGIANARLLYRQFKEVFRGERFALRIAQGAQSQRLLWAS